MRVEQAHLMQRFLTRAPLRTAQLFQSAQVCFVVAAGVAAVACASETGTETPVLAETPARVNAEVTGLSAPQHGFQVESPGVWIEPECAKASAVGRW